VLITVLRTKKKIVENNFFAKAVKGQKENATTYKREGSITYPWRSVSRRKAGNVAKRFDQDTEVSREHSRPLDPTEGSNV